ncbi:MAG: D-aminoacylase, partial [Singulisphaera sp.]
FADLVVFDPERIADRATFDAPQQQAVGVEHVIVNGTPIVAAGTPIDRFDGPLPGRALRYRG